MTFYNKLQETFQKEYGGEAGYAEFFRQRVQGFRREKESIVRIDKPTNLSTAKHLGYKAKQGIVLARVRIRKGSGAHTRPNRGRRPKRMGVRKLTRRMNIQSMAEQRAARKFPNLEVLNSYWVGEDGKHKYFEIIMLDASHPVILADKNLNWIATPGNKGRAFRGKTSAQRKGRGLVKGRGSEKNYPSQRAHQRKGK
ncbi:MAG: 50S ribosomal protein L15e [Candidatus Diapherotrites archaeon]